MKKKLFAILMSAMMLVTFMPVASFAAATPLVPDNFRTCGLLNEQKVDNQIVSLVQQVKEDKYKLINAETLKTWIEKGKKMVVIDVMPEAFYNGKHIPTAVNQLVASKNPIFEGVKNSPLKDQKKALKKLAGKNKKATIVVYCGYAGCDRSRWGAKYLRAQGYKNVYRFAGGAAAWEDAGYDFVDKDGNTVKSPLF